MVLIWIPNLHLFSKPSSSYNLDNQKVTIKTQLSSKWIIHSMKILSPFKNSFNTDSKKANQIVHTRQTISSKNSTNSKLSKS